MGFWVFMLVMDLLIPITMVAFGTYFLKNAPREINSAFGYRTAMSMKNRDTWEFAHRHCGRVWQACGLILAPASVIPILFVLGGSDDAVGTVGGIVCAVQLAVLIGSVLPTERALRRAFDENGERRGDGG